MDRDAVGGASWLIQSLWKPKKVRSKTNETLEKNWRVK